MDTSGMTHPIEVQTKDGSAVNDKGDTYVAWSTLWKGYAYISNLTEKEYWEAASVSAENTLKIITRWHPNLDMTDQRQLRILWRGKTLEVQSASNVKWQNEFVEFKAAVKNE